MRLALSPSRALRYKAEKVLGKPFRLSFAQKGEAFDIQRSSDGHCGPWLRVDFKCLQRA